MIFADSGFFIALLHPADELYGRACAWESRVTEKLLVTEYVLWEVVNYFSKPVHRRKVHAALAEIRSGNRYEVVAASPDLFNAGLQFHAQRPDKEWSLTDCISFLVMEQRGITRALAHDHHFEQAGFEALLRRNPPD